jgi:hypothetical protein
MRLAQSENYPASAAMNSLAEGQLKIVCFWHKADNRCAAKFVRFWTIADKGGFWPATVCPLMTQSGHLLLIIRADDTGRNGGKLVTSKEVQTNFSKRATQF